MYPRSCCFCSVALSRSTLCDPMDCSMPVFPALHYLPEFAQTPVHWVDDVIQPSHPLSSPSLPALNLSQHRVFSNELALCIRWPKYQSFSFSISPSSECSGLISFRVAWLDLPAIRGTLKSPPHHSSKHWFFLTRSPLRSTSDICTRPLGKPELWLDNLCWQSEVSAF